MKSLIEKILIPAVCAIAASTALFFIMQHQEKKIAVVDAVKLFNEYKMKTELEAKVSQRLQYIGHVTDSLKNLLQAQSKDASVSKEDLQKVYAQYMQVQNQFDAEYQETNSQINEQVWKRLNPLIDEYSKEQGLRMVIGANGMGTVLYNDDYYDHTASLIKYVNEKYEKGN